MRVMRVKCVLEKIIPHVERQAKFKKSLYGEALLEVQSVYLVSTSDYAERASNILVQEIKVTLVEQRIMVMP